MLKKLTVPFLTPTIAAFGCSSSTTSTPGTGGSGGAATGGVGGAASGGHGGTAGAATGGTAGGTARIQDHAQVIGGKVSGGTVGALTLLGNAFTVSGTSQAMTTFYPLDFFEGRNLTGGGLIGDVELRADHSTGTCSGFVDATTCVAPGTDATPVPPYTWR